LKFELIYEGNTADFQELDFYDVAQAMVGFQRSLALTTHLVVNGTIITQAPSLRGARVIARAPEAGSYKIPAYITSLSLAAYGLGTADTDTVLGHLVYSAYDYAISKTLGFNVDFDSSLGEQYERFQKQTDGAAPELSEERFDSLSEKIEPALKEIHRPIVKSGTATSGMILGQNKGRPFELPIDRDSYNYLIASDREESISEFSAKISSYNMNTFRGRAYLDEAKRPVPFILEDVATSPAAVARITASLRANAQKRMSDDAEVILSGYANRSPTGRLKSLYVVDVE
jgi:hypothetical protein